MSAWSFNPADLAIGLRPSLLMRRLKDEMGEPLVPDPWQEEYLDSHDPAVLLLAFRQSGKSTATAIKALHCALFWPGRLTLIVSPSDRQSGITLDKVRAFYLQLGGDLGAQAKDTSTELRFANGAKVVSLPGSNEETLRGYSAVRLLILDEAARIVEPTYVACLPMLADDGIVVAATTPKGRSGWFPREWREGEGWRRIRVPVDASPRMTEARLRARRARLTPGQFQVEYGLSFGGSGDGLFAPELIERAVSREVLPLPVDWVRFASGLATVARGVPAA